MSELIINGKKSLKGEIDIQGAKNSCLPILAACVLVEGVSVIHNCPKLSDVNAAVKILEHLGCKVERKGSSLFVDSRKISCYNIPTELMCQMRSSIVFLGSVLSRMKKAKLCSPGGCEIGLRPIDLHLSALRQLGVSIDESAGDLNCEIKNRLKPGVISLSFPSVGATENIMLASVFSEGKTVILNAAREPEVSDLALFLNKSGCRVKLDAQGTVVIEGVKNTHGVAHSVLSDRIVSLTYMAAVAAAGGDVTLNRACASDFLAAIPVFERAGCRIISKKNSLRIISNGKLSCIKDIRTMPFPGFPTDAQAPIMAMLCKGKGTSVIVENIFENRFKHVSQLNKMGAKIKVEGRVAIIDGVSELYGAPVEAVDLRGGGALVVAALCAEGKTTVSGIHHVDRGYEKIEECLRKLGADIERR